jgi:hypothetical protein
MFRSPVADLSISGLLTVCLKNNGQGKKNNLCGSWFIFVLFFENETEMTETGTYRLFSAKCNPATCILSFRSFFRGISVSRLRHRQK